jgi:hypothetical protein
MKKPTQLDQDIMRQLISRVARSMPKGGSEQDVTTFISRPMWKSWCRAVGIKTNSEPTAWIGVRSHRVYGSKTIIVEAAHLFAVCVVSK